MIKDVNRTFILPIKDSYAADIDRWVSMYENYRDRLDLKEFSKFSYEKLKKKFKFKEDKDGFAIIGTSHKIFDLMLYYNDPDAYYFDVMALIRGMKHDMQNPDGYYEYRYTSGEVARMSCIHFLFNMIVWMPYFTLGIAVTPDKLFMPKSFTNKSYVSYVNDHIIEPYKHLTTMNEMSHIFARMYDLFILISEKTALYFGLSFSLYDLLKRWNDNPELKEINHTVVPQDMAIAEGEAMLNAKSKRFQEIMMNEEPDNQIRPLLEAGQANPKQLKEFAVNISYKPDLEGRTLNTHPSSNFVSNGLRDPVDYVTDASGGRKASNLALQIDDSGYLQRTLCKSAADIILNPDPEYDCGSRHYYVKTIESKKDLESMNGRWYVDGDHLTQLVSKDLELIGKTLKFRSPTTCVGKNGICSVCYGHLYSQNVGINVGINSGLKLTERLYQQT